MPRMYSYVYPRFLASSVSYLSIFSRFLFLRSREDEGDAGSCKGERKKEKGRDRETVCTR